MTTQETAWLAGLFEGEGCISQDKRKPATFRLIIQMTDLDIIQRIHSITGVGKYAIQKQKNPKWKTLYRWSCGKREEVQAILSALLPYLGERRAYKALNTLDSIELL